MEIIVVLPYTRSLHIHMVQTPVAQEAIQYSLMLHREIKKEIEISRKCGQGKWL